MSSFIYGLILVVSFVASVALTGSVVYSIMIAFGFMVGGALVLDSLVFGTHKIMDQLNIKAGLEEVENFSSKSFLEEISNADELKAVKK